MNRFIRTALGFGFGISALAMTPVQAAVVEDQSSLVIADEKTWGAIVQSIYAFTPPGGDQIRLGFGQSITAGRTGYLDHLDFQLLQLFSSSPKGLVTINLYDGDILEGPASLVTTMTLDGTLIPKTVTGPFPNDYVTFDVRDSDFFVTEGQRFSVSFGFIPTEPNAFIYLLSGQIRTSDFISSYNEYNDYAGGEMKFYTSYVDAYTVTTDGDIGFRTFVDEADAPPVPEPASWAMMIGGFALAGSVLRRQRASARLIAA